MSVTIAKIGKSAGDLRFFIYSDGRHAGGITVHSIQGASFSYGVAIAAPMRRKGIAKAALPLLYEHMRALGFVQAVVQVVPENEASLALHRALGFEETGRNAQAATFVRPL